MPKFKLSIDTIDNDILEFPRILWFDCSSVVELGLQVIRQYDSNECIVSKKVFLLGYGGHRFGTTVFMTPSDYLNYVNSNCVSAEDDCCYVTYQGCYLTFNGKKIVYGM